MKTDYKKFFFSFFVALVVIWTISCSGKPRKNEEQATDSLKVAEAERVSVRMVSPAENTGFKLREPIRLTFAMDKKMPDSIVISFDSRRMAALTSEPWEYTISAENTVKTGRKSIKAIPYQGGKPGKPVTRFMVIYSDVVPGRQGYKVVHTYPHDRNAFTQGLFYDNGVLYEGTGQETGSSLREVDLQTGKVLRQHNLDASLFGEGITLYNGRIYQVTWEDKVGFVYDKSTFELINKIFYPTQGWGLTTINNRIVLSDGTNVLYFYEPEMFTVVSRLEIYDNTNRIDSINELEYINGEIWANIWMTDEIVRIDPESGKVKGYIDLKGLLPEADKTPETDVLNGIAYDQKDNRIFVTGKKWPKLFEIRVTE